MQNRTIEELTNFILEGQVALRQKNEELAKENVIFRELISVRDKLNNDVEEAKKELKKILPDGKIEKTLGEDILAVTTSTARKVIVKDMSVIPKEYLYDEEQKDVFEKDGKFYKTLCNTGRIQEEMKIGKKCPDGCSVQEIKRISMKFNGKVI